MTDKEVFGYMLNHKEVYYYNGKDFFKGEIICISNSNPLTIQITNHLNTISTNSSKLSCSFEECKLRIKNEEKEKLLKQIENIKEKIKNLDNEITKLKE